MYFTHVHDNSSSLYRLTNYRRCILTKENLTFVYMFSREYNFQSIQWIMNRALIAFLLNVGSYLYDFSCLKKITQLFRKKKQKKQKKQKKKNTEQMKIN